MQADDLTPALAALPSVDAILANPTVRALREHCSDTVVTACVRQAIGDLREGLRTGALPGAERSALVERVVVDVRSRVHEALAPRFRRVVNATGIVLHTNLGRAPLAKAAVDGVRGLCEGYGNLEVDLVSGRRGHRHTLVEGLLCELTGAEAAAVANNNAAAVLLALNTLALGREAVVSRGPLVEIGGSFRIPDIMARSGARMVEVGTTNRTHLRDFSAAIGDETGLLLAVHPSNYQVEGFTAEVGLADLVGLGREHGVPVAQDLGSGALVDLSAWGLPREPLVSDSVSQGADVVTFSGDKVLGGPQAGIIVGRREAVERIRSNPLMRALRCGKLTYAALEATLKLYLDPNHLVRRLPVLRVLTASLGTLRRRGNRLLRELHDLETSGVCLEVVPSVAQTGSGSLPTEEIQSLALAVAWSGGSVSRLATRLRCGSLPVLGYVRDDRLMLDLRTVRGNELSDVAKALRLSVEEEATECRT